MGSAPLARRIQLAEARTVSLRLSPALSSAFWCEAGRRWSTGAAEAELTESRWDGTDEVLDGLACPPSTTNPSPCHSTSLPDPTLPKSPVMPALIQAEINCDCGESYGNWQLVRPPTLARPAAS